MPRLIHSRLQMAARRGNTPDPVFVLSNTDPVRASWVSVRPDRREKGSRGEHDAPFYGQLKACNTRWPGEDETRRRMLCLRVFVGILDRMPKSMLLGPGLPNETIQAAIDTMIRRYRSPVGVTRTELGLGSTMTAVLDTPELLSEPWDSEEHRLHRLCRHNRHWCDSPHSRLCPRRRFRLEHCPQSDGALDVGTEVFRMQRHGLVGSAR
jgi:hypothetical protein